MAVLPIDATDDAIFAAVRAWVAALASGDFVGAYTMTAHDPYYAWSPDLIRDVIANYGFTEPAPDGVVHSVTPLESAAESNVRPAHEVTRWNKPRHVDNGRLAIGDVRFDLPLDGQWSDLTATFEIQRGASDIVLVLNEIHVF